MNANFRQSRNDLHWSIYDLEDGHIRWTGYDDDYWWNRVSKSEQFRLRIGPKTGRLFELNPVTNTVTITKPTLEPTP